MRKYLNKNFDQFKSKLKSSLVIPLNKFFKISSSLNQPLDFDTKSLAIKWMSVIRDVSIVTQFQSLFRLFDFSPKSIEELN